MKGFVTGESIRNALLLWNEEQGERRKTLLLSIMLFCVAAALTVGRTAADALFLSRFDAASLSWMYAPQAVAIIAAGLLFQKYGSRIRIDRLAGRLIPLLSLLAVLSRLAAGAELRWIFPVIYVEYEVAGLLMIVCFWRFAASVMESRKARRMLGIVAIGGLAGGIAGGFGAEALVAWTGTADLIWIYAGLPLLGLAAGLLLPRGSAFAEDAGPSRRIMAAADPGEEAPGSGPLQAILAGVRLCRSVPYVKYAAVASAALALSLPFIDFQFKTIVSGSLQNDDLAGFIGGFYGWAGLLALLARMFIDDRVLSRFGATAALLAVPVVLLAGSAGLLIFPGIAMVVVVKAGGHALEDTAHSAASRLLLPVPPQWRGQARRLLEGAAGNGIKAIAAVLLLALASVLSPAQLGYVVILLLGIAIAAVFPIRQSYRQALRTALRDGEGELQKAGGGWEDPDSRSVVEDALGGSDERQLVHALRIARGLAGLDLSRLLPGLLGHSSPEVAKEALVYVEAVVPEGADSFLKEMLDSLDGELKGKAVLALSAYAKESCLEDITLCLEDRNAYVQTAAAAGLVKHYGVEGMFRAVGKLQQWIDSGDEDRRAAAAVLIGQVGTSSFYRPLIALLEDSSVRVRIRALESAAVLRVPALIPVIAPLLRGAATRCHAVDALAAYGDDRLSSLEFYLAEGEFSLHWPKVCERIGTQQAFDGLLSLYRSASPDRRDAYVVSLARMHRNEPLAERAEIEALIHEELRLHEQYGKHAAAVAKAEGGSDIVDIVRQLRECVCRRIFVLLGLLYDAGTMETVYANWTAGDSRQQASAAETLEMTVQGSLRTELVRLMTSSRNIVGLRGAEEGMEEHLRWLSDQGDPWLSERIRLFMLDRLAAASAAAATAGMDEEERRIRRTLREKAERVESLRRAVLFERLPSRELAMIAMRLQKFDRLGGNTVIREGERGASLYMVRIGRLGVYKDGQKAGELRQGQWFGEMAVLTGEVQTATVRADELTAMWELDADSLYDLMLERPAIAAEMMSFLSRRCPAAWEGPAVSGGFAEAAAAREAEGADRDSLYGGTGAAPGERAAVLRQAPLLAHLSPDEFMRLAQEADATTFEPGQVICRAGDYGCSMFGIMEGSVRVHRGADNIATLEAGDWFGETALIAGGRCPADCIAGSRTVLLELRRDRLLSFCFENGDALRSMLRALAGRSRNIH
ncbi:Cyclic nucleotide-gated potassium channel [Paenibacillus konkukensis]|uniref:Cyclic nucleotide-gated potassium channel n=1 Tax=Paenibacillus konkukensis TaxID=2020716 RepID=A0ABY4RRU4_9BACL|nr:Cyclic nucleotide-gated potassium channel [Paenibacillus konkukensis]